MIIDLVKKLENGMIGKKDSFIIEEDDFRALVELDRYPDTVMDAVEIYSFMEAPDTLITRRYINEKFDWYINVKLVNRATDFHVHACAVNAMIQLSYVIGANKYPTRDYIDAGITAYFKEENKQQNLITMVNEFVRINFSSNFFAFGNVDLIKEIINENYEERYRKACGNIMNARAYMEIIRRTKIGDDFASTMMALMSMISEDETVENILK